MQLPHVAEAIDIVLKRRAEREAELARKREEAEALIRRSALSQTVEDGVVERLADLIEELGIDYGILAREGGITASFSQSCDELDEIELNYRTAVADLERLEAHYKAHPIPMDDPREYAKKSVLRGAWLNVEGWAQEHEGRRVRFLNAVAQSTYPRQIPARYRSAIAELIERFPPPERKGLTGDAAASEVTTSAPRQASEQAVMTASVVGSKAPRRRNGVDHPDSASSST